VRIVAGRHKGRTLAVPPGRDTRPTADRARETLFNVLTHGHGLDLDGAAVVDAFAGSGALGVEALSRGAARAYFLENHRAAQEAIRANLRSTGETDSRLFALDATRPPPAPEPCALALLDPPYRSGLAAPALEALARQGWLAAGALCVVEVAADEAFAPPHGFAVLEERRSGAARFVILERAA
jgi:16S rRNA (guanine966-N2)-methyltransferase